jgi:hypothetical protein
MVHYLLFVLFYLMILVILVYLGTFEYIPNQRNNPMLIYDNYAFNKCKVLDDEVEVEFMQEYLCCL